MPDIRQRVITAVIESAKPYRALNAKQGAERAYTALYEAELLVEGENTKQQVLDAILSSVAAYGIARTNLAGAELTYNALQAKNLLIKEQKMSNTEQPEWFVIDTRKEGKRFSFANYEDAKEYVNFINEALKGSFYKIDKE